MRVLLVLFLGKCDEIAERMTENTKRVCFVTLRKLDNCVNSLHMSILALEDLNLEMKTFHNLCRQSHKPQ